MTTTPPPVTKSGWNVTLPGTDLPSGGECVVDPIKTNIVYFHTILQLTERDPKNIGKMLGLWVSKDSGKTWNRLLEIRDLSDLIVHPKTEVLYAVIRQEFLKRRPDGILVNGGGDKIIMSKDGVEWKDITEGGEHLPNLGPIFVDPDNPNRICLLWDSSNILQSVDDEYSHWKTYTNPEWAKTHKDWDWNKHLPSWLPRSHVDE